MNILVDTNVWLCLAQPTSPLHSIALQAVVKLQQQKSTLCVVPQVLIEFWVVATRPIQVNELGLTVSEAIDQVRRIKRLATFLANSSAGFNAIQK